MMEAAIVVVLRLALGFLGSLLIGWLALQRQSLAPSGVIGAVLTGTLIFGLGGVSGGLLLIAFFVSSSALSHYKAARKQTAAQHFDKGGQRDLGQTLANGGIATLFAVFSGITWLIHLPPAYNLICFAGLMGSLASANADTWATELGVLSQSKPHLITIPSRVVEPGTSGGITLDGTLAAVCGALFIGLLNLLFALLAAVLNAGQLAWLVLYNMPDSSAESQATALAAAAVLGGVAGALVDSLIGAALQASYFSIQRNKITERRYEIDGTPNRLLRGWPWLNNDWVNGLASLTGAMATIAVMVALARTVPPR